MKQDLSDKRIDYSQNFIDYSKAPENPFEMFNVWYKIATSSDQISEPYAMSLATIGADGFPRTRIVLLREFNEKGFIFYTNYSSQKGVAIEDNPQVCLSFFWDKLEQQIIIKGTATKVEAKKSDEYFHKRPVDSQLGAVLSAQSSVIDFQKNLEEEVKGMHQEYAGIIIPRPENWGGFLVEPIEFEFWQGRPNRLHDRLRYRLVDGAWIRERLSP